MIPRLLEKIILAELKNPKIILVLGARQVGKTTLIKHILKKVAFFKKTLYLNCDIEEDRKSIDTTSLAKLKQLTKGIDILFIDEIQRLTQPGLVLKIIFDNLKTKIIATGSSGFEIKDQISEALTGRCFDFYLYPLSVAEILSVFPFFSTEIQKKQAIDNLLEELLLYGQYPEVFLTKKTNDKIKLLNQIVESYLFKDILAFQKIRYSQVIKDLAKAVAYQIGNEINENELANRLKVDRKTIVSYLDILERSFVIKKIYPFSRNPRREIGRRYKIYFIDLGIRNALIGDFNKIKLRADQGALWENFIVVERLKHCQNNQILAEHFFWRSYSGAEIDLIEKSKTETRIKAYEIKYQTDKLSKGAVQFSKQYRTAVEVINKDNYLDFIIKDYPLQG